MIREDYLWRKGPKPVREPLANVQVNSSDEIRSVDVEIPCSACTQAIVDWNCRRFLKIENRTSQPGTKWDKRPYNCSNWHRSDWWRTWNAMSDAKGGAVTFSEIPCPTLKQSQEDGVTNQQPGIANTSLEWETKPMNLEPDSISDQTTAQTNVSPLGDINTTPMPLQMQMVLQIPQLLTSQMGPTVKLVQSRLLNTDMLMQFQGWLLSHWLETIQMKSFAKIWTRKRWALNMRQRSKNNEKDVNQWQDWRHNWLTKSFIGLYI